MNNTQEYKKAYYLKNKVKINANRKEQQREYYLKNKNNIDKQKREYRFQDQKAESSNRLYHLL